MDSQSFVSGTEYVKKINFIQIRRKREVSYFEAVSACFTDTLREIPWRSISESPFNLAS